MEIWELLQNAKSIPQVWMGVSGSGSVTANARSVRLLNSFKTGHDNANFGIWLCWKSSECWRCFDQWYGQVQLSESIGGDEG
jgi:hypothetical protein